MSKRIRKAVLFVLVVGQLGLVGCATPQVRAAAPSWRPPGALLAPSWRLTTAGVEATSRIRSWTTQSRLEPMCGPNSNYVLAFGSSDGEWGTLYVLAALAIVTCPVWGPFYLLHELYKLAAAG